MDVDPSRLRRGELIVGAGALVLLASMFALHWFGLSATLSPTAKSLGVQTSVNGWDGLTNLRWLVLVAVACSFLLVYFQATRRAPAIPVSFSVIVTVVGILTALALVYRVLINEPGPDGYVDRQVGAYVGLVSSLVLVYGGYASMRQEGTAAGDAPAAAEIEVIRLSAGRS